MSNKELNTNLNKDELQAHIEEYKSTQAILNYRYTVEHNIHYWSILLLIAFTSLSFRELANPVNHKYLYILFVLAFPFHLLSLLFLRNDLIICANAEYYNKKLRPRLKYIIGSEIWMREDDLYLTRQGLFNILLGVSRYGTTLIAFPTLSLIYFFLKDGEPISLRDSILFLANVTVFLLIIVSIVIKVPKAVDSIVDSSLSSKIFK